jgi:hypothetical protein
MTNITAYRALVAASNAAHRNAELAAQGVRDIEAQIAQLSVYLERAKDAQRLAESHAASIDAALEKIDAAEAAEGEGSENAPTWMPIETAPKNQTVVVWPPSFSGATSSAYWDDDKFAKSPRPYWVRIDASKTDSRLRPPTHWRPVIEGPTK